LRRRKGSPEKQQTKHLREEDKDQAGEGSTQSSGITDFSPLELAASEKNKKRGKK
jgi:hypothetical protein